MLVVVGFAGFWGELGGLGFPMAFVFGWAGGAGGRGGRQGREQGRAGGAPKKVDPRGLEGHQTRLILVGWGLGLGMKLTV